LVFLEGGGVEWLNGLVSTPENISSLGDTNTNAGPISLDFFDWMGRGGGGGTE